jgi:hypothetical protein
MRKQAAVLASALVLAGVSGVLYLVKKPYSLCEIAQHPRLFAGRAVVIKGTLYGYSGGLIHLGGNGCEETQAWATVNFSESLKSESKTKELLTSIRTLPDRSQYLRAEVIIAGDLEDLGDPCFAPKFVIAAKTLHQLTPGVLVPFPSAQD